MNIENSMKSNPHSSIHFFKSYSVMMVISEKSYFNSILQFDYNIQKLKKQSRGKKNIDITITSL